MFVLEYKNTSTTNEWVFIGKYETRLEMNREIADFFTKHNYVSHYQREWMTETGHIMIDFGSHIQFYRYKIK